MDLSHINNSWYLHGIMAKARGIDPEIMQAMKYQLDKYVYYYGEHFKFPLETPAEKTDYSSLPQYLQVVKNISKTLRDHPGWVEHESFISNKPIIVSNSYFSWNSCLASNGFEVRRPIWEESPLTNELEELINHQCLLIQKFFSLDFQILLSAEFIEVLSETRLTLKRYYSNKSFITLLVPYVNPFFEYVANQIFQELGKKTFLSIHGMCWAYSDFNAFNIFEYNAKKYLTDYYLVWGQEIANQLPKHQIPPNKVLVTGHPDYNSLPHKNLSFDFDRVLVCTRSMGGSPMMNLPSYQNRADLLDYVYRVQVALQDVGVKKATLRPHPCESPAWYWKYIDREFYTIDELPLRESLTSSTVVIGPASTVFIESLLNGTNYVLFDPFQDYDPINYYPRDSPFDGSHPKIPMATSNKELVEILKEKLSIDRTCINEFVQTPFNLEPFLEVMKNDIIYQEYLAFKSRVPSKFNTTISEMDTLILEALSPYLGSTNSDSVLTLLKGIEYIYANDIQGSIVELNDSKGGEMMAASFKLIELNDAAREIVLYNDSKLLNAVRTDMVATTYPEEKLKFLDLSKLDQTQIKSAEKIALLRIDSNSHDNVSEILKSLYPYLSKNAVLIFNRFDKNSGSRFAWEEFSKELTEKPELKVLKEGQLDSSWYCIKR